MPHTWRAEGVKIRLLEKPGRFFPRRRSEDFSEGSRGVRLAWGVHCALCSVQCVVCSSTGAPVCSMQCVGVCDVQCAVCGGVQRASCGGVQCGALAVCSVWGCAVWSFERVQCAACGGVQYAALEVCTLDV